MVPLFNLSHYQLFMLGWNPNLILTWFDCKFVCSSNCCLSDIFLDSMTFLIGLFNNYIAHSDVSLAELNRLLDNPHLQLLLIELFQIVYLSLWILYRGELFVAMFVTHFLDLVYNDILLIDISDSLFDVRVCTLRLVQELKKLCHPCCKNASVVIVMLQLIFK
jgi:hypothetical protein